MTATATPRVSLSEVVRAQFDQLARRTPESSSLELTRNAKGQVQIGITVRTGSPDVDSLEQLEQQATAMFDRLCNRYPFDGGAA